jgi:transcription antitermination factor NusG
MVHDFCRPLVAQPRPGSTLRHGAHVTVTEGSFVGVRGTVVVSGPERTMIDVTGTRFTLMTGLLKEAA